MSHRVAYSASRHAVHSVASKPFRPQLLHAAGVLADLQGQSSHLVTPHLGHPSTDPFTLYAASHARLPKLSALPLYIIDWWRH